VRLEEGVPLLPKKKAPQAQSASIAEFSDDLKEKGLRHFASGSLYGSAQVFDTAHNDKLIQYDHDTLLTTRSLMYIGMSTFAQRPVLLTLAYCITLASLSAIAVFFLPRASKFDAEKFSQFAGFLKVFIAFMLGTYVTQAFKRWWYSVSTFEKFLTAIQQMFFLLHTIRGQDAWRKMIETYCVCSGYILNAEIRNATIVESKNKVNEGELLDWLASKGFLSDEECHLLKSKGSSQNICTKTRAVWSWIGELVSHPIVEEGINVPPPLLARVIMMCQNCVNEIEHLKMNVTMQMPFMYAQLLSILVHANNTILALNCGLAVGSAMNEIRRRSEQLSGERDTERREISSVAQLYGAVQTVGFQLVILILAPMLYVGFLHIAHMLCYPFGDKSYNLPTETLIARLHADLNRMSEQRSYIRQKHAEWKEMEQRRKKGKDDDEDDEADADDGGD